MNKGAQLTSSLELALNQAWSEKKGERFLENFGDLKHPTDPPDGPSNWRHPSCINLDETNTLGNLPLLGGDTDGRQPAVSKFNRTEEDHQICCQVEGET